MRSLKALMLLGSALLLIATSAAQAATLSIGLQEAGVNGGAITTVGVFPGVVVFPGLPYGSFTSNSITAAGSPVNPPPNILGSTALDVSSSTPGTLRVYVTSQGNVGANSNWVSTFTENQLPAGWQITEETFLSVTNALYSGVSLGSAVFNSIGTSVASAVAASGNGPFSVTHLYTIVATGAGTALSTINLQTPLPGAALLFGSGLLGLGLLRRKRKQDQLTA